MSAKRLPWHDGVPATRDVPAVDADRRDLVKLLGMGGLVLLAGPGGLRRFDALATEDTALADWEPHVYVSLAGDGTVTIICHRSEMGQGIRTTMPMIIADEMEADWSKVKVQQAVGDAKYGSQNTDGSTSIRDFLFKYREAGATVRALLEDAAAKEWGGTGARFGLRTRRGASGGHCGKIPVPGTAMTREVRTGDSRPRWVAGEAPMRNRGGGP